MGLPPSALDDQGPFFLSPPGGHQLAIAEAAFGSTIRMHMGFFDTPELLGLEATNLPTVYWL